MVFSDSVVNVYATSKPSVPQFSVTFIDNSYYVPATQTTDPYTGITITQPSHVVKNGKIDVTINNLSPTPHKTPEGYVCDLYYRVQYKGHFEEKWVPFSIMYYGVASDYFVHFVKPSDAKYTIVSLSFSDFDAPPSEAQLDFRVQALYAYRDPATINHMEHVHDALLVEEMAGDWSKIQIITITYGPLSSSQTVNSPSIPTLDPDRPPQQTPWASYLMIIFVTVCIITIPLVIVTYLNKQIKNSPIQT
ncbi:MAG: hypothetical protein FWH37_10035 [Candidatus Bathyarchaeota archaeon]|nr:hypothetical protein [Candidatus Termiticorpusculum sp.]